MWHEDALLNQDEGQRPCVCNCLDALFLGSGEHFMHGAQPLLDILPSKRQRGFLSWPAVLIRSFVIFGFHKDNLSGGLTCAKIGRLGNDGSHRNARQTSSP